MTEPTKLPPTEGDLAQLREQLAAALKRADEIEQRLAKVEEALATTIDKLQAANKDLKKAGLGDWF